MADAKEPTKVRTFSKKGPDGQTLTRSVATVSDEVSATFDGFVEQTGGKAASSTSSSKPTPAS